MKVVIAGGTGLIGRYAAMNLLWRGHEVVAVARREPAPGALPEGASFVALDLMDELPDDLFAGVGAVVFAAGTDYRVIPRGSAREFFRRVDQEMPLRFFQAAVAAGVEQAVFVTSYYHAVRPSLAEEHPYIRVRMESEEVVLDALAGRMSACVIQPPFILGAAPGRFSVGTALARYVKSPMPLLLAPPGGTNFMAASSLGEAIATAAERGTPGARYLVGDENLRWTELVDRFAATVGRRGRARAVPEALWTAGAVGVALFGLASGREPGVEPVPWSRMMAAQLFLDPAPAREALGYSVGNLPQTVVELCRD